MKALKLLAPLIIAPLLALAGFVVWWKLSDRVAGSSAELTYVFGAGPPAIKPPMLAQLDVGARRAFDFGVANDAYPQEWWYFNAHLVDEQNRRYGLMMALLKTGQVLGSLTMVQHEKHRALQQMGSVQHLALARTVVGPMARMRQLDPSGMLYEFRLDHQAVRMTLRLTANKPPLPVGGRGLIDMGEGGESYYYSLTNMNVEGVGRVRGNDMKFRGKGWMDHQWGDWDDKEFDQWFWYSIQLADNTELMLYEFRRHSKRLSPICDVVMPDGTMRHGLTYTVKPTRNWVSPTTGRNWSVAWRIQIPDAGADLQVTADRDDQEVIKSLWEGSCKVEGTFDGKPTKGLAFYEARARTW
jgi:predicted secreted hydrolase